MPKHDPSDGVVAPYQEYVIEVVGHDDLRRLERKIDLLFARTMIMFQDVLTTIAASTDSLAADLGTLGAELQLLLQRLGTETVTQAMIDQGNAIVAKLSAASAAVKTLVAEAAPADSSTPKV
jgi:hypothetical protein